ncbi:replication endonuclease [Serratia rubidaea]|uniref:replication endonuclease n=1 Tax=Serratia rubidaea TaxID=61652 RepID=UPI001F1715A5|nr:replication endonuclease [Serratia rubidaea]UJD79835.1 replication endonuclease [Serratia rubidaea]UJD84391.1 replication endonuclease [Serratia rubidaea]
MTKHTRSRTAPSPPPPFPGSGVVAFDWPYSWNAPKKGINPYTEEAKEKPQLTAAQKRRQRWIEITTDRERDRESQLSLLAQQRRGEDKAQSVLDTLMVQPDFIRSPLLARINAIRNSKKGNGEKLSRNYILRTIKTVMTRIERMRDKHLTFGLKLVARRERLDDLLRLPELDKRAVQLLATFTAAHFESLLDQQCKSQLSCDATQNKILRVYVTLGTEAERFGVIPPSWQSLNPYLRRRGEPPYDKIPGAISRLCCANWWFSKLWSLRCRWREELLRAAGLVRKQDSAYISADALAHFREQRRRTREFLKAFELTNDDGFSIDLEDAFYAGPSNPRHRRIEMMTTVKGMQEIAEMRGDCAVWCTITTPSRFHATKSNGRLNPKWTAQTVRDSNNYLVNRFFASVRKKLNRNDLRWYGIRVAEPHHDGTVHWHMMVFCRPDDRDDIIGIMQTFAIRDDRAELGNDITPRFKTELITAEKGSPISYIATYIGKNLDAEPLRKPNKDTGAPPVDHESGKSMADTVEHALGWASLHRIHQFQFFGIPSRQVYRELRRLATQLDRQGVDARKNQRLTDKAMDDVMSAADAGCIATYIMKQGGVLTPRRDHVVHTAYLQAEKPNDYGEHGIQIFGVWSPVLGEASRICTHPDTWTLKRKRKPASGEAERQGVDLEGEGAAAAPWTRGNNCPPAQNPNDIPENSATGEELTLGDFDMMSLRERRQLLRRIRALSPGTGATTPTPFVDSSPLPEVNPRLMKLLTLEGIEYTFGASILLRGSRLKVGDRTLSLMPSGQLKEQPTQQYCQGEMCCAPLHGSDLIFGDVGLCLKCTEKLWGHEEIELRQREVQQVTKDAQLQNGEKLLERLKKVIMRK